MKKTTQIQVSSTIELSYDEDSIEFQEALEGYREIMEPGATVENMLRHVAFYVARFGSIGMIEGVGYLHIQGTNFESDREPFSGIEVLRNFGDEIDCEII